MRIIHKNIEQRKFQVILWIIIFITNFISNLQFNLFAKALALAILALVFYAAIIYGNAYWLIPAFYSQHKFTKYVLLLLLLLIATVLFRSMTAVYIDNIFSAAGNERLTTRTLSYSALGAVWICFISVMYRLALNYFALR